MIDRDKILGRVPFGSCLTISNNETMLRQRRKPTKETSSAFATRTEQVSESTLTAKDDDSKQSRRPLHPPLPLKATPQYACAEAAIQQGLAAVFLVAFLGAWYQNEGLMGDHGLQPARTMYWEPLQSHFASRWQGFLHSPSVFWWIPLSDFSMYCVIGTGILLSSLILLTGRTTWLWQFALWLLYFSIVSTASATSFYSYGWESQMLETAFLSLFLCPFPGWYNGKLYLGLWPPTTAPHAPSAVPRWLFRWLIFRITLGAGLIKLRGSSCWHFRTCLYYHFETQPIPSPLSFVYHFLPRAVHRRMIDIDLLVQVYTCWFVLVPPLGRLGRWILRVGGFLQIGLMVGIILSGNFACLNHLTILPALACMDDACWPQWWQVRALCRSNATKSPPVWRRALDLCLLCTIGYLSWPVVSNLWGDGGQIMNGSFDSFRLVNTYGAFGSVGQARFEPIISVSTTGQEWIELDLPCKPGNVNRRPCFCAPNHHRLDWNIWFLGFPPHKTMLQRREKWLYHLLTKLLLADETHRPWLNLLDSESARYLREMFYEQGQAPAYVKVDMYRYRMAASLGTRLLSSEPMAWWNRTFTESLIPIVKWDSERQTLQAVRLEDE